MKVYIAAPLFNEMEKRRNKEAQLLLQGLGFETYLPQEDGGVAYDLAKDSSANLESLRAKIFESDIKALNDADIILALLDGRVPDEGLCVEVGYAYARGKKCIGYVTDNRIFDLYGRNLMLENCLEEIAISEDDLKTILNNLK